jgi:hypothetical protein
MDPQESYNVDLDLKPGESPTDGITVRELRADRDATGEDRRGYYEQRIETALRESGIRVSLAAEIDGLVVGFVIGRVYHGEYGHMDTFAVDTFRVLRGISLPTYGR